MNISEIFEQSKSAVIHINFVKSGQRIASGSAFVVNDLVVTNNHVFSGPRDCDVIIRFADSDPSNINDGLVLSYADFSRRLKSGSDANNYDFAVLDIPEVIEKVNHSLSFGDPDDISIGQQIVFLGYPFEHLNLTCHTGIVSSKFLSGPASILQLDASVNHSNSGGPLLDASNGHVLGIITRKATGLSTMFQELLQSFEQNIKVFQASRSSGASVNLAGVDPIAALEASQRQMQRVALEIERSANVGIGYAFSIEHISLDPAFNE